MRDFDVAAEVFIDDPGVAAFHWTVGGAVQALGGVNGRPGPFIADMKPSRRRRRTIQSELFVRYLAPDIETFQIRNECQHSWCASWRRGIRGAGTWSGGAGSPSRGGRGRG